MEISQNFATFSEYINFTVNPHIVSTETILLFNLEIGTNSNTVWSVNDELYGNEEKTSALVARANFCKHFVWFLEELRTRKIASEII